MKFWSVIIYVVLMAFNVQAVADDDLPTISEDEVTKFHLARDLTGYVKSKTCETCKEKMSKITPEVFAKLNNKIVPLSRFVLTKQKPDHLVFTKKTEKLVGMIWFTEK